MSWDKFVCCYDNTELDYTGDYFNKIEVSYNGIPINTKNICLMDKVKLKRKRNDFVIGSGVVKFIGPIETVKISRNVLLSERNNSWNRINRNYTQNNRKITTSTLYFGVDVFKGSLADCNGTFVKNKRNKIRYFKTKNNLKTGAFVESENIHSFGKTKQSLSLTVGDIIFYKTKNRFVAGIIRYAGKPKELDSLKTDDFYFGIELEEPLGKNNGTIKNGNIRYFKTRPKYGIFVKSTSSKIKPGHLYNTAFFETHLVKRIVGGFVDYHDQYADINELIIKYLGIRCYVEWWPWKHAAWSGGKEINYSYDRSQQSIVWEPLYLNENVIQPIHPKYRFSECLKCHNMDKTKFVWYNLGKRRGWDWSDSYDHAKDWGICNITRTCWDQLFKCKVCGFITLYILREYHRYINDKWINVRFFGGNNVKLKQHDLENLDFHETLCQQCSQRTKLVLEDTKNILCYCCRCFLFMEIPQNV